MSVLEIKNISKAFGELEVIKDISLNVEKGEVVAIIAPPVLVNQLFLDVQLFLKEPMAER